MENRERVKKIKKSEELTDFIDSVPDLFMLADASDWSVLTLNKSMAQSLGKTKKELLGKNILNYFPPNVVKIRKEQAKKVIRTRKPAFFEDEREGRWFENAFYPVFDSHGKVIKGSVVVREITSQKKAEKALIESEEKFKNLAEQSPNMIFIKKKGKVVYANKICEEIMGYLREELYSPDFDYLNLIAPEYKELVKKSINMHMKGEEVSPFEYALLTKNGERIVAIYTTKLIQYEGESAILGIVTDITKYKKIEEDIRQMKDHLQNILDSTSELVFVVDENLDISTWNKTAERTLGYKQREVIGKSLKSFDLFDNLDSLIECIESINKNKITTPCELVLRTKTSAKRLLQVAYSNLRSETGEKKGVLFMGRDITKESETHGKLIPGNCYIIIDKTSDPAINLFKDLTITGYSGLFITRDTPEAIQNIIQSLENVEAIILSQEEIMGFKHAMDLDELTKKIESFTTNNSRSLILLDRIDYLITNFSFDAVIKELYRITDTISRNKGVLLVRLNPSVINISQLGVIEEELKPLPGQKIDAIELEDYLYGVLLYIDEQNQHNIIVSFKKIGQKFSISKVTTAKRLNILEKKGLIFIKKHGKTKTIHISEKGKTLLHRRKII